MGSFMLGLTRIMVGSTAVMFFSRMEISSTVGANVNVANVTISIV